MPGSNTDALGNRHKGSTTGRKKYTAQDSKDVASCYVDLTTDAKTGLAKSGVEDLSGKLEKAFNEVTASHTRVGKNLIQHWGVLNRDCRVFDLLYTDLAKDAAGKSEERLVSETNAAYAQKTSKCFKFEEAWRVLKQTGRIEKGDGFDRIKRTPISHALASASGAGGKRKRTVEEAEDDEDALSLSGGGQGKRALQLAQTLSTKLDQLLTETTKQNAVNQNMAVYSSAVAELAECREWVTMEIPSDLDADTKASLEKLKTMGIANLPKLIDQLEATKQAMSPSV